MSDNESDGAWDTVPEYDSATDKEDMSKSEMIEFDDSSSEADVVPATQEEADKKEEDSDDEFELDIEGLNKKGFEVDGDHTSDYVIEYFGSGVVFDGRDHGIKKALLRDLSVLSKRGVEPKEVVRAVACLDKEANPLFFTVSAKEEDTILKRSASKCRTRMAKKTWVQKSKINTLAAIKSIQAVNLFGSEKGCIILSSGLSDIYSKETDKPRAKPSKSSAKSTETSKSDKPEKIDKTAKRKREEEPEPVSKKVCTAPVRITFEFDTAQSAAKFLSRV